MGATSNAIFTEMASTGNANKVLTEANVDDAQLTFWRFVHSKHTPFALEPVDFQATASQPRFGGSAKYTFPRQGDLCWQLYAKLTVPAIVGTKTDSTGATVVAKGAEALSWCDAVGFKIVEQATLSIGNVTVDTVNSTYTYVWEELCGKPGKRLGEMVGKFDSVEKRQAWAKRGHVMYVPIPFSFTQNTGSALPLVSLQFHPVAVDIQFSPRSKLVVGSAGWMVCSRPDGVTDEALESGRVSVSPLQDSDLQCEMEAGYVYLEDDERDKFSKGAFEQIIDETQMQYAQALSTPSSVLTEQSAPVRVNIPIQFNNVVSEYIFGVRSQSKTDSNNHFDFTGPVDPASGLVLDPIKNVTIKFNNANRVQTRPGQYFRFVQPYQHHSNVPSDKFIYTWSFGIDPEDVQPTGGANHSKIEHVNLELELDPRIFTVNAPSAEIFVFARNKNVIRYKFGLLHKKF